jgi:hypothetical protein
MPDELPKRKLMDPGRAVLWDAHCGEPIGWRKLGEPIIAEEWSPEGSVILTDMLTPARAVELYGPDTAITVGPGGGWRSVPHTRSLGRSRNVPTRRSGGERRAELGSDLRVLDDAGNAPVGAVRKVQPSDVHDHPKARCPDREPVAVEGGRPG